MKRVFVIIECDCPNCTNDTFNFCKVNDKLNDKIQNEIKLEDDIGFFFNGTPSNLKTARKLAKILGFKRIKKRDVCQDCYKKFKKGELKL